MAHDLAELTDGRLRLHFHAGQRRAWASEQRFVLVLAGTQGGKTSFGPHWLYREIQRRGPGDYLVATPTFTLLELKALPEFRRLFENWLQLGRYVGSPARKFVFSEAGARRTFGDRHDPNTPTQILFGYAADPDSLESATVKAAWLDEAGQRRFKLGSWEAIQRRLSIHQGRALITTTPYDLGWLKRKLFDPGQAGDPTIEVVRFDSTENPAFPQAEFERARATLPRWKFNLFYRAIFERPAGLIYDSFDETTHTIPRFAIDPAWTRYLGLDFGGVHTAGVFFAAERARLADRDGQPQWGDETGRLFLYRIYLAGGRTAKEHAQALLAGEPMIPFCVGGSKSEGQWRQEFAAGGLPVLPPDQPDVEVGIDRVYGAHKAGQIIVLKDPDGYGDLDGYIDQKTTYSRVLDAGGEPTEAIEDKHTFHYLDAERYIISYLRRTSAAQQILDYYRQRAEARTQQQTA